METISALLVICAGNSPVTGEFPAQRPVTRSFDVFFDLRLNKRLSTQTKKWLGWWFETPSCPLWRHCNDWPAVMESSDYSWPPNMRGCITCWRVIYRHPQPWSRLYGSNNIRAKRKLNAQGSHVFVSCSIFNVPSTHMLATRVRKHPWRVYVNTPHVSTNKNYRTKNKSNKPMCMIISRHLFSWKTFVCCMCLFE